MRIKDFTDETSAAVSIAKMEIAASARIAITQVGQDIPHHTLLIANSVYVSGIPVGPRFLVTAYGHPVPLTQNSFILFFLITLQSYLFDYFPLAGYASPWLNLDNFVEPDNQAKYIYRLRTEIKDSGLTTVDLFANNARREYRSMIPASALIFDMSRLTRFADVRVSSPAKKLCSLSSIDPSDL